MWRDPGDSATALSDVTNVCRDEYKDYTAAGKREMLDFTQCVIVFNCSFTASGRVTLSSPGFSRHLGCFLVIFVVDPRIDQQGQHQNAKHHAQRDGDRDMVEVDDQHLDADKDQDHRQAVLEH